MPSFNLAQWAPHTLMEFYYCRRDKKFNNFNEFFFKEFDLLFK